MTTATAPDSNTLKQLNLELTRLLLLGVASLIIAALLLSQVWQPVNAIQWLLQSMAFWLFIYFQARHRLPLNKPGQSDSLYGDLGWANRLTLLRACLIAATGGFLFQDWPAGPLLAWLPGTVYFFGAILDRVDGYVARKTNHSSLFGNDLDMVSDALGLAIASLLAWGYGQVHWTYLLFGAAYYIFHGGLLWRQHCKLPVYPLPPAMHRRAWAGFQMGFLVVALWPWFFPPTTTLASFAFMLPALIGFAIDWLFVSGRLAPDGPFMNRAMLPLISFSAAVIQPLMRLTIVVLLAVSLQQSGFQPGWFMTAGFIVAPTMIVLGIAGRAACLAMIGLLATYYAQIDSGSVEAMLFCLIVWVMLLGTGRFSLWQPDQQWLHRYDGA
ncbi:MAG: CDP-alcohol phosphatidyltransferase family protein [Pseudomonadales bacterium]|nr:CDP-alcohol phosphatidyltransferase family protein [Pseudomonadales bacterium]